MSAHGGCVKENYAEELHSLQKTFKEVAIKTAFHTCLFFLNKYILMNLKCSVLQFESPAFVCSYQTFAGVYCSPFQFLVCNYYKKFPG